MEEKNMKIRMLTNEQEVERILSYKAQYPKEFERDYRPVILGMLNNGLNSILKLGH
jgi:hypothetical protein